MSKHAAKESVWDYPRPPRLEACHRHLRVVHGNEVLVDSHRGLRLLETSHPPTYYLPPADIRLDLLVEHPRRSFCEWKGLAHYLALNSDPERTVGWFYPKAAGPYRELAGFVSFYASRLDECWVEGERVQPQAGDFYGGWITADIEGPFKGGPGTLGW